MNSDDGKQLPKRGRPKKIKTIEEIDLEKQRKKEIKQKWYEKNKNNIIEKNKNYYYDNKEQRNSAVNILNLTKAWLERKKRPDEFCHKLRSSLSVSHTREDKVEP